MTTEQAKTLKRALELMFLHVAQKQTIMADLDRIEKLHQEIAPTAPPMLLHYLKRRSYAKALQFLEEGFVAEAPDRPECEH